MDASLARGHARATIAAHPNGDAILHALHHKPKHWGAVAPMLGTKSRRSPNTAKLFSAQRTYVHASTQCFVAAWSPEMCHVVGWTVTGVPVLHLVARDGQADLDDVEGLLLLRSEASVTDPGTLLTMSPDAANLTVGYSASLSRHAIQRMLQRGGTTPERVKTHALKALVMADTIQRHAQVTKTVGIDFGGTFLLPWKDGALVASAMRIRIRQDREDTRPHLSVRTYLDAAKLSDIQRTRITPLAELLSAHKLQDLAAFHSMRPDVSPKGPGRDVWAEALMANKDDREYRPQRNAVNTQDAYA